jgi:hypothetical protein
MNVDIDLPSTLTADLIIEELTLVMRDALKDYGIGLLNTSRWTDEGSTYRTEAAVCYSTAAEAEAVMADLLTLLTRGLREDGYRVMGISLTHDLTEPHSDADAAFGEDKFNR